MKQITLITEMMLPDGIRPMGVADRLIRELDSPVDESNWTQS